MTAQKAFQGPETTELLDVGLSFSPHLKPKSLKKDKWKKILSMTRPSKNDDEEGCLLDSAKSKSDLGGPSSEAGQFWIGMSDKIVLTAKLTQVWHKIIVTDNCSLKPSIFLIIINCWFRCFITSLFSLQFRKVSVFCLVLVALYSNETAGLIFTQFVILLARIW